MAARHGSRWFQDYPHLNQQMSIAQTDDWTMLQYRVSLSASKPVFPDGAKAFKVSQES